MSKRCGFINGNIVMMDREWTPEFDEGTIWTNLANHEVCLMMDGEKKLIRVDGGIGIDNIQRVITRVEKDENDDLVMYYIDLTIVDGITTEISLEESYTVPQ